MPKIESRSFLKRKQKKHFLTKIDDINDLNLKQDISSKSQIEQFKTEEYTIYIIDGKPLFAESEETFFPVLFNEKISLLPKIVVDMGAISYICNGANIMVPGIVRIEEEFKEKDLIIILDEKNKKPVAVCQALFNSETIRSFRKGKVSKNLHYVGDRIWNSVKNIV
jgi:PUA domain protein